MTCEITAKDEIIFGLNNSSKALATYFEKPSGSFKSVFRKSGFMHMVNNFKVAGKY